MVMLKEILVHEVSLVGYNGLPSVRIVSRIESTQIDRLTL